MGIQLHLTENGANSAVVFDENSFAPNMVVLSTISFGAQGCVAAV